MRTRTFGNRCSLGLSILLFAALACTPNGETTSVAANAPEAPQQAPSNTPSANEPTAPNVPPSNSGGTVGSAPAPADIPKVDPRMVGTYKIVVNEEAKQMMRDGLKSIETDARAQGLSEEQVQAQINNLRSQMTAALEATRLSVTAMGTFTIEINGQSKSGTFSVNGNSISFVQSGETSLNIEPVFVLEFNPEKQTLTGTQDGKQMVFAKA